MGRGTLRSVHNMILTRHAFWCWVSLKAQTAIVRGAKAALARHVKNQPDPTDNHMPTFRYERWADRKASLVRYLQQESHRLTMMGGDA